MATLSLSQLLGKAESLSSSLQAEAARLAQVNIEIEPPPDWRQFKKENPELPGEDKKKGKYEGQAKDMEGRTQQASEAVGSGKPMAQLSPVTLESMIDRGMLLGDTYDVAETLTSLQAQANV